MSGLGLEEAGGGGQSQDGGFGDGLVKTSSALADLPWKGSTSDGQQAAQVSSEQVFTCGCRLRSRWGRVSVGLVCKRLLISQSVRFLQS